MRPPPRADDKANLAPRDRVEATRTASRGGNRGRGSRSTLRRIERTARQRQDTWRETGQPNLTERLTRDLDELYDALRDQRKGANPGPHLRTSQAQWKSEVTR